MRTGLSLTMCVAVLFCAQTSHGQTPIGGICAKASVTAVQEILKDSKSQTAKGAFEAVKTNCSDHNHGEASAKMLVGMVHLAEENNRPMPASCTDPS